MYRLQGYIIIIYLHVSYDNHFQVFGFHLSIELERIPAVYPKAVKAPWGSNSGIKEELQKRNLEIRKLHECGTGITELAELFYLSEDRIRAILYTAHVF